jgi:hypothetical protein
VKRKALSRRSSFTGESTFTSYLTKTRISPKLTETLCAIRYLGITKIKRKFSLNGKWFVCIYFSVCLASALLIISNSIGTNWLPVDRRFHAPTETRGLDTPRLP